MTRKALGRGLNALLGDAAAAIAPPASTSLVETSEPDKTSAPSDTLETNATSGFHQIPIGLIDPNPFQPRRAISEQQLQELADSIHATGIVQPVLVRRVGERYQLVAGERRWRAASVAKLQTVPAVVRDLADREALEIAIAENVLREDLTAIEVARAFESLHEKFGYSHEEIAARLGMDRTSVTNTLRLLKLPLVVQQCIEEKLLTAGHARALLACTKPEVQITLAVRAVKEGLSVRDVERLAASPNPLAPAPDIGKFTGKPAAAKRESTAESKPDPAQDPNVRAAVLEMERTLGTKVKVVGSETSGRIEISYYSPEDLNRLYEWIARK
ncbi:MAG TPA: ParB/RepB/Spo0J family partition protein [Terriglobia bacterium]|nr:ParB/RepB/Spo0J family partition protein [Terriglobia bacterium]